MDMKKEFPSQVENRKQWILDTVRENQHSVRLILEYMTMANPDVLGARGTIKSMHKQDRDALLQPGGILTNEQIDILSGTD